MVLGGIGEIALWSAGRTGATLGLLGIAALAGGIALARHGYQPKRKPTPARRASQERRTSSAPARRPVHVYADETPKERAARLATRPAARVDRSNVHDLNPADRPDDEELRQMKLRALDVLRTRSEEHRG
jgi:hypothetical protein